MLRITPEMIDTDNLQDDIRTLRALRSEKTAMKSKIKIGGATYRVAQDDESLLDALISPYDYMDLIDALGEDEQSVELANQVYRQLYEKLRISRGELEAYNRLRGCVEHKDSWDAALLRNNIFKAAHALGIQLPSYMF